MTSKEASRKIVIGDTVKVISKGGEAWIPEMDYMLGNAYKVNAAHPKTVGINGYIANLEDVELVEEVRGHGERLMVAGLTDLNKEIKTKEETIRLFHRGPKQPRMTIEDVAEEVMKVDSKLHKSEDENRARKEKLEDLWQEMTEKDKLRNDLTLENRRLEQELAEEKGACIEALGNTREALRERDELKKKVYIWYESSGQYEELFIALQAATGGHTLENLKKFTEALPSPDMIEGKELDVTVFINGERSWTIECDYYTPIVEHKEPKLLFCLQVDSTWQSFENSGCKPGKLLAYKLEYRGKRYDKILDTDDQVWIGHWNDGLKEETP